MDMLRRWTGRNNGGSMERSRDDEERREMMELSRPLLNLRERIDRMFDDFFDDFPMPSRRMGSTMWAERTFQPRMDLSETANAFKITADVPGMSEDDIDITVSDNNLIINGERSEESEETEQNFVRRERAYGMFHRQIPLPGNIERDKINAKFKNGVLTVELPKDEEAKSQWRKIEVKSG